jgi:hypothetical protein
MDTEDFLKHLLLMAARKAEEKKNKKKSKSYGDDAAFRAEADSLVLKKLLELRTNPVALNVGDVVKWRHQSFCNMNNMAAVQQLVIVDTINPAYVDPTAETSASTYRVENDVMVGFLDSDGDFAVLSNEAWRFEPVIGEKNQKLVDTYTLYTTGPEIKVGDLVKWKPNLKNKQMPDDGQVAVAVKIAPDAIDAFETHGSRCFRERVELRIGLVYNGRYVEFHVDPRRMMHASSE